MNITHQSIDIIAGALNTEHRRNETEAIKTGATFHRGNPETNVVAAC